MEKLAKILVSGVVQGVGFRYFVFGLAKNFGLPGIVKNLYDSRVYIEVEGNQEIIKQFIRDVKTGNRWSVVKAINVEWENYSGKFKNFDITY